jgi:hypothetical protein
MPTVRTTSAIDAMAMPATCAVVSWIGPPPPDDCDDALVAEATMGACEAREGEDDEFVVCADGAAMPVVEGLEVGDAVPAVGLGVVAVTITVLCVGITAFCSPEQIV